MEYMLNFAWGGLVHGVEGLDGVHGVHEEKISGFGDEYCKMLKVLQEFDQCPLGEKNSGNGVEKNSGMGLKTH